MPESIFTLDPHGHYLPTENARGPWDPGALHGGAPAALITSVLEGLPDAQLHFARLSFSFLRPIPMAPLTLDTRVTRPGRRVQELQAELCCDQVPVCRAHALAILPAPSALPDLATPVDGHTDQRRLPGPQHGRPVDFSLERSAQASFAASAIEMRFLSGRPLVGGADDSGRGEPHAPTGDAQVWMRLRRPLVPGQQPSPLARLVAAADFGNGVAAALPFERYVFINADLQIWLQRRPEGQWIALDSRTLIEPGGIAWARSVLHDERGPVGVATQALVVQPR